MHQAFGSPLWICCNFKAEINDLAILFFNVKPRKLLSDQYSAESVNQHMHRPLLPKSAARPKLKLLFYYA